MLRNVVRAGIDSLYDRRHRIEAARALRTIERQMGTTLSRQVRRKAEAYAVEVLGSKAFAPWLFVYSALVGEFREGWIPDNYYGRIVCPNINGAFRAISGVKTLTRQLFQSDRIPDVAYIIDGRFFNRHLQPIDSDGVLREVFVDSDEAVVKVESSGQGQGVWKLSRLDFDPVALAASTPKAVIQTRIRQHRIFDTFAPGGATTLRLTTVRESDATFRVRAAYLRVPFGKHEFVQSSSSVRIAVDRASGVLASTGYLSDWKKIDRFMDPGAAFAGIAIPGYSDAVRLCEKLHEAVPQVGCIGWDLLVDCASKVWLLEWNANHNDVRFSEAFTGPCFTGLGWEHLKPTKRTWQL